MWPFFIAIVILALGQVAQLWQIRRLRAHIRALRFESNTVRAAMDVVNQPPARRGDDPGRLLPEARQLLHDLDQRANEAKPVIDNLTQITLALRGVCEQLNALLVKKPPMPL